MQNVSFSFTVDLNDNDSLSRLEKLIQTLRSNIQTNAQTNVQETKTDSEKPQLIANSTERIVEYLNTKKSKGAFIYGDLMKNAEKIGIHRKSVYGIADKLIKAGKAIVVKVPNPEASPSAQKEQAYLKLVE